MRYIRALKKQLDFKARLIDIYDMNGEPLPPMLIPSEQEAVKYPKSTYCALRVNAGTLHLILRDEEIALPPNSLWIAQSKKIESVKAQGTVTVTFYNFSNEKAPAFFRPDRVYHVPFTRLEEQLKQTMLLPERENELALNSALHALFQAQYYGWISAYEKKDTAHSPYEEEIRKTAELIESDPGKKINFSQLSKSLNLSERNFRKLFTAVMGMSPKSYQQELRLKTAASILKEDERTMAEVSEELGYYSQFQFSRDFKKRFGVTPTDYKKNP